MAIPKPHPAYVAMNKAAWQKVAPKPAPANNGVQWDWGGGFLVAGDYAAAAHDMGFIPEVAKSKEPPLELNLAAKKASPFTQLHSVEELAKALKEGRYIEYQSAGNRFALDPIKVGGYAMGTKHCLIEDGLYAHNTTRVILHGPCVVDYGPGKELLMWTGNSVEQWLDFRESDCFVKSLGEIRWFKLEEGIAHGL